MITVFFFQMWVTILSLHYLIKLKIFLVLCSLECKILEQNLKFNTANVDQICM